MFLNESYINDMGYNAYVTIYLLQRDGGARARSTKLDRCLRKVVDQGDVMHRTRPKGTSWMDPKTPAYEPPHVSSVRWTRRTMSMSTKTFGR